MVKGLSTRKADRAAIVAIWAGGGNAGLQRRAIEGVRVVQSLSRENENMGQFDQVNRAHLDANVTAVKLEALMMPTINILTGAAFAIFQAKEHLGASTKTNLGWSELHTTDVARAKAAQEVDRQKQREAESQAGAKSAGRVVVVVTDGDNTAGRDPQSVAQEIHDKS